ncbi:MAG: hypothetical protein UY96_C0017G0039 [Parcubacteria group bacterium GW2011_GWB1_56_8]|nr:MAG: hypothetical protein UY96_C0017G0039 [Parcubacteria group bacterium GW2011_GWB1_56_8]
MAMTKFTVDTTLKLFIAKTGVIDFIVGTDLYSDAKEHWLTDSVAMGFDFPVRTVGGDPTVGSDSLGASFFMTGGWKIRPDEASHTLDITGNLFVDGGGSPIVPTLGAYTVLARMTVSNLIDKIDVAQSTEVVDALMTRSVDGVAYSDLITELLAVLSGKMTQVAAGKYAYKKRDDTTTIVTLEESGTNRLRS